jgi:hypothetical protein
MQQNTIFLHSKLNEVDFTEKGFTTAFNYPIDMDSNKIKKSKHSKGQLGGLLEKYHLTIE